MAIFATAQGGGDRCGVRDAFSVGSADVLIGWGPSDRSQCGKREKVRFEVGDLHRRDTKRRGSDKALSCITNKKLISNKST